MKRTTRFTLAALAVILLSTMSLQLTGCTTFVPQMNGDASVTVWNGLIGLNTRYVPPNACLAVLVRSDTTVAAAVDTAYGPVCVDAHQYVRSFFAPDTSDGIPVPGL